MPWDGCSWKEESGAHPEERVFDPRHIAIVDYSVSNYKAIPAGWK